MESRLAELKERNPWLKAKQRAPKTVKVNYAFNPDFSPNAKPVNRNTAAPRAHVARNRKAVRCLDTGQIFATMREASLAIGLQVSVLAKAFCYARKRNRTIAIAGGKRWEVVQ